MLENKSVKEIGYNNKIDKLVRDLQPDEIYFLAAYHSSSEKTSNFNVELNLSTFSSVTFDLLKYSVFMPLNITNNFLFLPK